jgi:type I restriction enzyme, S subunit
MSDQNKIPKHWREVTIKDIAKKERYSIVDGPFGTQMKVHEFVSSGIPLIEMQNIDKDKFIPYFRRFVTNEKFEEIKRSAVTNGDVIISKTGSLGYVTIIPEKFEKAVITSRLAKLSIDWNQIEKKYFFHYLIYLRDKGYWQKIAKGTTMKILNIGQLADTEVPLPPMLEQQTIVSKLEELLSDLENGKQQLQLAQQQLKVYRQSLLKWAFEGKLTAVRTGRVLSQKDSELPEGWKTMKTGEVIDIINNGYTPTKEYLSEGSGEIPFIKVCNLNFDGTLNFRKNPTFIPHSIHKKNLKRSICYPNDVLINIVGPPLGKVSIVSNQYPEWNINQAIVLFRPNENILSKYISYFLQNPVTINWLEDTSKATAGQWNVKVSTCRLIPIPIPPIDEQQQIVDELESKLTVCDKIEETIIHSLQQAETLRQSILKKAFEGKLI